MLEIVGLGEREEAVYRGLVESGSAGAPTLARDLGVTEAEVAAVLKSLTGRGLVTPSGDASGHHVPAPPALALTGLLAQRRHELAQAEAAALSLAEDYRRTAVRPAGYDVVDVVAGAEAVRNRFEQVRASATREVLALVPGDTVAMRGAEELATGRGVGYRVVIERRVLDRPGIMGPLAAALDRGQQVRVVDRVPTELLVSDGTVGLVPLVRASAEPSAVVVHAAGMVDVLVGLFEAVWAEARPVVLTAGGATVDEQVEGPDETDVRILSLLLLGQTDSMVAKQLELGLRTVQRRMRRLMELTGVDTRMQLGWHVAESGWISR
ncbi:helix-turn-helix domain-containing protein [Streptomyces sp. NBC_00094]|uniref:helix-turn-helix domain-containing protein n=1 Tax=Streptomyces sp. NBC_00094 TaxID=2903620 RepID=UPI002250DC8B|nr:helix-turn-helix domain-containing protein [Streptomyces sp. NBC_00094]MCX5390562.1 helix-turn-helix transcriptional regulator [Streptomyces sp. NBC_00094]